MSKDKGEGNGRIKETFALALRRAPLRLAMVLLLSFLVAGAFYGVSLSPVGQSMASARGGRGAPNAAARPSTATTTDAVTPAAVPSDASASQMAAPSLAASDQAASVQTAPAGRPTGGGGRPASLQRGLPELARNAGVIAVVIVIVAGTQAGLKMRRRPRTRQLAA